MILFLEPFFQKKPWAGEKIKQIYNCDDGIGEAWIVSGYNKKSSVIKNGSYKGQTLRHVWNNHPELFANYLEKEFPILIKIISSAENLSVQVHPNDSYAIEKCNQLGKFECWYFLPENGSSKVINGINVKNAYELKTLIENHELSSCLEYSNVSSGDLVVIEPGRIHSLMKDSLVLEIQESSDVTYRLFDFDRLPKRELHIEDSLNVINYGLVSNNIFNMSNEEVFNSKFFRLEKLKICGTKLISNCDFSMIYVISGNGSVDDFSIKSGDSFIVTSDSDSFTITGNVEILIINPRRKEKRSKLRKIALITGVTSSIGFYLCDLLLNKGYEVHGIIQSDSKLCNSHMGKFLNHQFFFTHLGDITDTSNVNRIIENVKPDEIYHLACQSRIDASFEIPEYTTQVNALGTLRLLDAIKNSEIRTKLFNMSSCYLFSGDTFPQNELSQFEPKSPYAVSKLFAYYSVKNYRESYNLFAVNGICYNQASPLKDSSSVLNKIVDCCKKIKNGNFQILELGNINSKREWGHSQDYAYAMWSVLQLDNPGDYIISSGEAYSIRELVEKIYSRIGINIHWCGTGLDEVGLDDKNTVMVKINSKLFRPFDGNVFIGDSNKFCNATGYRFEYDIEKLIDSLLED